MNYDEIFDIFKSSYVGKEIKKEVILDKLSHADDREIIERFVTNIYIEYSVKAENINQKAEENFEEIQILGINIIDYRAIYDIYGILLSIIPYPILAIFRYNDRVSFAVSNRILAEDKNNKGKIYTSYLIKEEDIVRYLKIDIDSCQSMIEIYNKWIFNVEDVISYYERLDRVIGIIEIEFHIKSNEVLEKLESYIVKYCGTYNMKPKEGWKSKLEKYSNSIPFEKKVETHMLWEYLSENTFLKNKLEYFSSWNDFKEACSYNNNMNDIYYSQYNSRMSDDDEIYDICENRRNNNRYIHHNENTKVEIIKSESKEINNIDNTIQDIVEEVKEKGVITYSNLAEILSEKFDRVNPKIISKVLKAFEKNNIELLDEEDDANNEFDQYKKQLLQTLESEPTVLAHADYEIRNDKMFMLQAIKIDSFCIRCASDRLKNDSDFMLQAIEEDDLNMKYASDNLKNDKDFMIQAIKINYFCIIYASDRLKNDKEFMLLANEINGKNLAYAGDNLKNDRDFMLKAIKKNIWALAFASDNLRNDTKFILQASELLSGCIKYASERIRNDKDIVLKAIEKEPFVFKHISDNLQNDNMFIIEAIERNIRCIEFVSNELQLKYIKRIKEVYPIFENELQNDRDFMMAAIEKDSFYFVFASDELKKDKEFLLKAIKKDDSCLGYASDKLKNDKEFMMKVIKKDSLCLAYVSNNLKKDKEFILQILAKQYLSFAFISEELRKDREFMLQAIKRNGETVEYASEELRNDKDFMLQAISCNAICFPYASDKLKNNKDFVLQAIAINCAVIEHLKDIFRDDKDVILKLLEIDEYGIALLYASDRLKNNKEFMLQVVDINIKSLEYLGDKLRNDSDFILKAFEKDSRSLEYASDRLKNDEEFMLEINKIIENNITLEFNYVYKEDFLNRNKRYGLFGYLEENGISVLEKNEFCMKIVNRETGQIIECNHTPLFLINDVLKEPEMKDAEYIILDWKLHISVTTEESLKNFDDYMRQIKMTYSIYQNNKNGKKIIIEYQ